MSFNDFTNDNPNLSKAMKIKLKYMCPSASCSWKPIRIRVLTNLNFNTNYTSIMGLSKTEGVKFEEHIATGMEENQL